MQRTDAGSVLQRQLAELGFVEAPRRTPNERRSQLGPATSVTWTDIWTVIAAWARIPVDLGPASDDESDSLLFSGTLDLGRPELHEPHRPGFVLEFKRYLSQPNKTLGYVEAESIVTVRLFFRDHDDFRLLQAVQEGKAGVIDTFGHVGGADANDWQAAVEATASFRTAVPHALWASSFSCVDELA